MKKHHWLHVRTGEYRLTDHVRFHVSGNAGGVVITLSDFEHNRSYWVHLHDGRVTFGDISTIGAKSSTPEPRTVIGAFTSELGPEGYLPETGIEFDVTFPSSPLPTRRLRVLGGYQSGRDTRIIYREVAANVFTDRIARFASESEIVLHLRPGPTCLLPADWLRFGGLPSGGKFRIGRQEWSKMSAEGLAALMKDKCFICTL